MSTPILNTFVGSAEDPPSVSRASERIAAKSVVDLTSVNTVSTSAAARSAGCYGGSAICEHGRQRHQFKDCGGV